MFVECEMVRLKQDISDKGLKAGTRGTVVMVYDDGEYEVEFAELGDEITIALPGSLLESATEENIAAGIRTRGPQKAPLKNQVTLRLDAKVIEYFKKDGKGWQTRMNDFLRAAIGVEKAG